MNLIIKICGMRDASLAIEAVKSGADMIGLIFHPQSSRYIDVTTAATISAAVKNVGGEPVAVFVDQNAEEMFSICQQISATTVQCHGDTARQQQHLLPELWRRIYVFHIDASGKMQGMTDSFQYLNAKRDFLLFDSVHSGSGQTFHWQDWHNPYVFRYLLAGGLQAQNVGKAIRQLQPDGVDVSSGVESSLGVKDLTLIREFISAARKV